MKPVAKLIELVEAAPNLAAIPDVKKLKAKGNYYRIKLGDYRIGITLKKDEITSVRESRPTKRCSRQSARER